MFYITAHTVTQNQFANVANDVQLPIIDTCSVCVDIPTDEKTTPKRDVNKIPIILLPSDLQSVNHFKLIEKNSDELHQAIASFGLRSYLERSLSESSTQPILKGENEPGLLWGCGTAPVMIMGVIFALLLFTLITLVIVRISNNIVL